jgi:hypothetical protein
MAKLTNYTYWTKDGVVKVSNSFVEDEQYRKDGWIKSSRGAMEWYKRSLAKQETAATAAPASTDGVDVENRDGHIFDMPLKDGGTARAVWLPETNANIRQLFIEQGHSARLHQELAKAEAELAAPADASTDGVDDSYARGYEAGLLDGYTGVDADWVARFEARQKALEAQLAAAVSERDAAIDTLRPFEALWADWFTYCSNDNQPYKHILEWLLNTHIVENVGKWLSTAAGVVRNHDKQAAAAPTGEGTK